MDSQTHTHTHTHMCARTHTHTRAGPHPCKLCPFCSTTETIGSTSVKMCVADIGCEGRGFGWGVGFTKCESYESEDALRLRLRYLACAADPSVCLCRFKCCVCVQTRQHRRERVLQKEQRKRRLRTLQARGDRGLWRCLSAPWTTASGRIEVVSGVVTALVVCKAVIPRSVSGEITR